MSKSQSTEQRLARFNAKTDTQVRQWVKFAVKHANTQIRVEPTYVSVKYYW